MTAAPTTGTNANVQAASALSSLPIIGPAIAALDADAVNLLAVLLGIVFLIVGLVMFKPVQQTIVTGAKVATKVAA